MTNELDAFPALWPILFGVSVILALAGARCRRVAAAGALFAYLNVPNRAPLYPAVIVGTIAVLTMLPWALRNRGFIRYSLGAFYILTIIVLANTVAVVRGNVVEDIAVTLGRFVEGYALVAALWGSWHRDGAAATQRWLCWVMVVSCFLGLWQLSTGGFVFATDYAFYWRFAFLAIEDANYSGLYLTFLLATALLGTTFEGSRWSWITVVLVIVCIALTLSRTTYVVAVALCGAHFYWHRRHRIPPQAPAARGSRVKPMLAGLALVAMAGTWLMWTRNPDVQVIDSVLALNRARLIGEIDTVAYRTDTWLNVVDALSFGDWLIGKGDIDIRAWNASIGGPEATLHSLPLTIVAKYGIFAALAYVLYVIAVVVACLKRRDMWGHYGACIGITYFGFTLFVSDEVGVFVLFLLASAVGLPPPSKQPAVGDQSLVTARA